MLCFASGPACGPRSRPAAEPPSVARALEFRKLIDSSASAYSYAYAPAIVEDTRGLHIFYCSTGTSGIGDWDNIRYVWSSDGGTWSPPVAIQGLQALDPSGERANCDPSVVRYRSATDESEHYYLFYSANRSQMQTVVMVARSKALGGPYEKWNDDLTWASNARNPRALFTPRSPKPDGGRWYGAGQQSLVVRNGKLYLWYVDDTTCAEPCTKVFVSTSTNATDWSPAVETNVRGVHSPEVSYDELTGVFSMYEIAQAHSISAQLVRRTSPDGVTWGAPTVLCDADCLPDWSHNVGASRTDLGHSTRRTLIAFGAPYDLDLRYRNECREAPKDYCWGAWDLYGAFLD